MAKIVSNLSDSLSSMKFMQRGKKQTEIKKKDMVVDDVRWFRVEEDYERDLYKDVKKRKPIVDYDDEDIYMFTRRSYQNYNPKIEKIMKEIDGGEVQDNNEKSVTDAEMAERYSSLVGTIGKKFSKKRNRNDIDTEADIPEKRVFLKPKD